MLVLEILMIPPTTTTKKNVEEDTVFIPFNTFTLTSHCESDDTF